MFGGFCDRAVGPARLPLVPSSLCPSLETLLRRLRDERTRPALRAVSLTDSVRAKISAFADDITVFVSSKDGGREIREIAGTKVNFDKSEGWVPGRAAFPCQDPSVGVMVPSASLVCGSSPASSWREIGWKSKVEAQVVAWLRRRLSLKCSAEVCAGYIFLLILYRLSVLPLS